MFQADVQKNIKPLRMRQVKQFRHRVVEEKVFRAFVQVRIGSGGGQVAELISPSRPSGVH